MQLLWLPVHFPGWHNPFQNGVYSNVKWGFWSIFTNLIYSYIKKSGPSCSKLTTLLVNISLKFQTLISQICQYFLLKKCEKLLIFSTKNIIVFCNKFIKQLTSWPLNKIVKLTMLWTTGLCSFKSCPSLRREAEMKMTELLSLNMYPFTLSNPKLTSSTSNEANSFLQSCNLILSALSTTQIRPSVLSK